MANLRSPGFLAPWLLFLVSISNACQSIKLPSGNLTYSCWLLVIKKVDFPIQHHSTKNDVPCEKLPEGTFHKSTENSSGIPIETQWPGVGVVTSGASAESQKVMAYNGTTMIPW